MLASHMYYELRSAFMTTFIVYPTVVAIGVVIIGCVILKFVDWKSALTEPIVVASVVAAVTSGIVAIMTLASGAIASSNQKDAAIEQLRTTTLLSIIQQYASSQVPGRNENNQKQRMAILIQSGIVRDNEGSICMALIKEGCPIKVLKVSPP